jgi:hypothetical protein
MLFLLRVANNNHNGLSATSSLIPLSVLYNRDSLVSGAYPLYNANPTSDDPLNGYTVVVNSVESEVTARYPDSGGEMVTREYTIGYSVTKGTFSSPPTVAPSTVTRGVLNEALARGVTLNYTADGPIRYYSGNRWNIILDPVELLERVANSYGLLVWLDSHAERNNSTMSKLVQGVVKKTHMYFEPGASGVPL